MKMTHILWICILSFFLSHSIHARRVRRVIPLKLNDFQTDGCSAYPDGFPHTNEYEWLHCCIAHDMAYWVGGTKLEKVVADQHLNQCVSEATNQTHGTIMELGVALGGTPFINTTWKWGYGWNKSLHFSELDDSHKEKILIKFDTILDVIEEQKDNLTLSQIGFVISRYELLRHNIYEEIDNKSESMNQEERYQRVLKLFNLN